MQRVNVRGKQGRKKNKFQGCTPNKTRRTLLYDTPREAAVALAKLKERPEEQADPIRHIDFASPALPVRCRFCCLAFGRLAARRSIAAGAAAWSFPEREPVPAFQFCFGASEQLHAVTEDESRRRSSSSWAGAGTAATGAPATGAPATGAEPLGAPATDRVQEGVT